MKLVNRFNGQTTEIKGVMSAGERSLWRLKKRIRDFDTCVQREGLSVSFLTVTQSDKSIGEGYRWISKLMDAMRQTFKRSGAKFYYVAVLEIQPKRYRERGVLAPHWHIAIGTSGSENLPHASRTNEGRIKKERNGKIVTWDWLHENIKQKFGMYFVCDCYSTKVYNYLGKYIAKGIELEDFRRKLGRRVRVFSASRMPVEFQMSVGQYLEREKLLETFPEYSELYWRREDSRIVARCKSVEDRSWKISSRVPVARQLLLMGSPGQGVECEHVARSGGVIEFFKTTYPVVHTIKADWLIVEGEWSFKVSLKNKAIENGLPES